MVDLVKMSDFLWFPLKCFEVVGVKPFEVDDGKWRSKLRRIYHHSVMANLFKTIIMVLMYIKEHVNDLVLITKNAPASGSAALAYIKMASFSLVEFKRLIGTLEDLFPNTKEEQILYNVQKYANEYRRVERLTYFMFFSVVVMWILTPLFKLIFFGTPFTTLPYENWFPFNQYDPNVFPFVVIWQFMSSIIAMAAVAGPDLFFYASITILCMQFDILCHKLHALKVVAIDKVEKELMKLIELHDTLLGLTKSLEKIYSTSILLHFVIATVWICIVGFQVLVDISLENFLKHSDILVVFTLGVFLICFYGQKLTTASANVTDAIYDFQWDEKHNQKHRILLLMMIRRSQKPNFISAQKFSPISLEVFATILSWSYSYLTLLRTVYDCEATADSE